MFVESVQCIPAGGSTIASLRNWSEHQLYCISLHYRTLLAVFTFSALVYLFELQSDDYLKRLVLGINAKFTSTWLARCAAWNVQNREAGCAEWISTLCSTEIKINGTVVSKPESVLSNIGFWTLSQGSHGETNKYRGPCFPSLLPPSIHLFLIPSLHYSLPPSFPH